MVRIQDSQSWHRGSIPLSTTKCFHVLVRLFKLAFSPSETIASYFFALLFGSLPYLPYLCKDKKIQHKRILQHEKR